MGGGGGMIMSDVVRDDKDTNYLYNEYWYIIDCISVILNIKI